MFARAVCFMVFEDVIRAAASRTFCTAGSNRPMRIAMMAMTTNNSIRVNPRRKRECIAPSFPRIGWAKGERTRPRPAAGRNASRDVEIELVRAVLGDGHFLLRVHIPVRWDQVPGDDVAASGRSGPGLGVHRADGRLPGPECDVDQVPARLQLGALRERARLAPLR